MECKVNIPELGDRFTQLECMYMKGEPCSRLFGRRGYYLAVRDETNENAYTVRYGNENLNGCSLGGDVCALLAERLIRKNESRYISKETSFERKREDLRKWYIESKSLPF